MFSLQHNVHLKLRDDCTRKDAMRYQNCHGPGSGGTSISPCGRPCNDNVYERLTPSLASEVNVQWIRDSVFPQSKTH